MTEKRGRLQLPQQQRSAVIFLLMQHYRKDCPGLIGELDDLFSHTPELRLSLSFDGLPQEGQKKLNEMARRWGLKAPWGAEAVLRLKLPYLPLGSLWPHSLGDYDFDIEVKVKYNPLKDDWPSKQREILEQAELQRQLVIEPSVQWAMGAYHYDFRPQLEKHIRWLFLHICPQELGGNPLGFAAIAELATKGTGRYVDRQTVKNAVTSLARQLDLTPPSLPPGRPRKYPT